MGDGSAIPSAIWKDWNKETYLLVVCFFLLRAFILEGNCLLLIVPGRLLVFLLLFFPFLLGFAWRQGESGVEWRQYAVDREYLSTYYFFFLFLACLGL